jgi:hypothetical protein
MHLHRLIERLFVQRRHYLITPRTNSHATAAHLCETRHQNGYVSLGSPVAAMEKPLHRLAWSGPIVALNDAAVQTSRELEGMPISRPCAHEAQKSGSSQKIGIAWVGAFA